MKVKSKDCLGLLISTGLIFVALILFGSFVAKSEAEEITWNWDHSLTLPNTSYDQVMVKELPPFMSKATNGRLKINILYGLGNPAETLKGIQDGRFDGGAVVCTFYGGTEPFWNFGNVSFFFENMAEFRRGAKKVGRLVSEDFEAKTGTMAVTGPVPWTSTYVWTVAVPLRTVEDWRGAKIRGAGLEDSKTIKALGAAPVTMVFGEVYTSLQRRVIDGFMTSLGASISIKPWEVTKYLNLWSMGYHNVQVAVNRKSFEKLPDDLKPAVLKAFQDFTDHAWDVVTRDDAAQLELQKRGGMTIIKPSDQAVKEFRSISEKLLEDWIQRTGEKGKRLVEMLRK